MCRVLSFIDHRLSALRGASYRVCCYFQVVCRTPLLSFSLVHRKIKRPIQSQRHREMLCFSSHIALPFYLSSFNFSNLDCCCVHSTMTGCIKHIANLFREKKTPKPGQNKA